MGEICLEEENADDLFREGHLLLHIITICLNVNDGINDALISVMQRLTHYASPFLFLFT